MSIAIFLGTLIILIVMGMPIAFALMLTGIALMIQLNFFDAQLVAQNMIAGADIYPLMAVPCFILAGELMNAGGISKRIINLAVAMVSHINGGWATWPSPPHSCWVRSPARRSPTQPLLQLCLFP